MYIWEGKEPLLQLFPLSGFGSQINFGYSLSIKDCISLLSTEENLLTRQLNDINRREPARSESEEPVVALTPEGTPPSGNIPRVFISSTIDDLADCRSAAIKAATQSGCFPVLSDDFPATGHPPLDVCLKKVSQCDVLVVIVAKRYGWIPTGPPNEQQHSITWLECEQAVKEGKEVLAFLVDKDADWPLELSEEWSISAAVREGTAGPELLTTVQLSVSKLKEFKQWLNTGRIRKSFSTSEDLHRQIFQALVDWKQRHFNFEKTASGLIYQPKTIEQDPDALVARGIAMAVRTIRDSFGPRGKLLTTTDATGRVQLLKRGVAIAQAVRAPEKFSQLGVSLMSDLARHVSDKAGDGTKTAIMIAGALVEQGMQHISQGVPAVDFCAGLERAGRIIALIALQVKPMTEAILPRLTAAAAHGDELSLVVSDAIKAADQTE